MTTITTRAGKKLQVEDDLATLREKIRNVAPGGFVEVSLTAGGQASLSRDDFAVIVADR